MPPAPRPPDEASRLASLAACGILDTPPDPHFERLVDLAAEHFNVPLALISMLDAERQWFKAARGTARTEARRDFAFCAHAILRPGEVMVVADSFADPRFADLPWLASEPAWRFYAGAPILAEDGQPVGTICVLDHEPRALDAEGRRFLAHLAASASAMLELHRRRAARTPQGELDPLTGLANRQGFDAALARAVDQAVAGVSCGLICLELDEFTLLRDASGTETAEAMLREAARRLCGLLRAGDTLARLGGDAFAVIVAGPVDLDGMRAVARKLLHGLAIGLPGEAAEEPIRCSLGLALAPVHAANPARLLRAAEEALDHARRAGGGTFMAAAYEPRRGAAALPPMEAALRQAIAADRLDLVWQPYFATADGRIAGCEALVRWNRPGFGAVAPSEFIARAEQAGLSAALDRWVLRHACAAAAGWAEPISVSVNISPDWFAQGDLVGLVAETLAATGLPACRLVLELTERTLVEQAEAARAVLAALRGLGVRSALDDFGTGYSALGYLYSFNFDKLKLDRSFVAGLGHNSRAGAVCRAVVELGHALGAPVCAEGVETAEQLSFLRGAGCDLVQGFLLGRPEKAPALRGSPLLAALARGGPPQSAASAG